MISLDRMLADCLSECDRMLVTLCYGGVRLPKLWYAEAELQAALAFWRQYHTSGARRRVREAVADLRSVREG